MSRRPGLRSWRAFALGMALYAVFLVTAPFGHTEHLACPVKSTFHCISCSSTVVGADPHTPTVFNGSQLTDAGLAVMAVPVVSDILLPARSVGRSPPAA